MNKTILLFSIIVVWNIAPSSVLAQIADGTNTNNSIALEESQGKSIYDKLQTKQTNCSNLVDNDFELLGDYFMGQMMGSSHATMDTLMSQRMGEDNNKLMHITLGKRLSGCNTTAVFPSVGAGFLPMMGMMGGSVNDYTNFSDNYSSMMGFANGYGLGGGLLMIVFWVLIIALIVLGVRGIIGARKFHDNTTPLEILKERYAKGEISKKEFEEKKKDLI